jgi:G:T/U-mismatch repair DNA glycosylase
MSGTIAELGIAVDSGDAVQAATDLDKLTEAGNKAEKAADDVTAGFKKTADAADKLAEAEARAAQATADAKARLLETATASLKNSEYYQRLTTSVTGTATAKTPSGRIRRAGGHQSTGCPGRERGRCRYGGSG